MEDFSTLIGGIAGDGINEAGVTVARLFNRLGYRIFMYYDYPSLIRGGHNFAIVRASEQKIGVHEDYIDVLIALNQETFEMHKKRLKEKSFLIYDLDKVKVDALEQKNCGLPVTRILKELEAPLIMRNTCILGGFCKVVGIDWSILEDILKKHLPKKIDQNLQVARRGFDSAIQFCRIDRLNRENAPLLTGNQAIGLGLIKAGLGAYIAYPMTPSSSLLDFMARSAQDFGLKIIHPENEIAVMLMAQGFAYAGVRAAVGTSGGGFCLMTEGLSLAGMSEMPVVVMLGQRTGPSTGLPTYTAQSDLHFILNAGQGEFPRFVVSPGDSEDAYYWSGIALNMAWKYQVPSFILSDKMVCEALYSFDRSIAGNLKEEVPILWDGNGKFKRYSMTETGISPLSFPPQKGQAIKADSYAHDEFGITTEEPLLTKQMADKRLQKGKSMAEDLRDYEVVKVLEEDVNESNAALVCWGSNKAVCKEVGHQFGLRVVQVLVLSPFPAEQLKEAVKGLRRVICVECNSTGQLSKLAGFNGQRIDEQILKYDGRPFSLNDLVSKIQEVMA